MSLHFAPPLMANSLDSSYDGCAAESHRSLVEAPPSNNLQSIDTTHAFDCSDIQAQAKCSTKCALEIHMIDDTALFDEPSLFGNGKPNSDDVSGGIKTRQEETGQKKEKRPRRRGGKSRKNKDVLNCCFSIEKKEKKGIQYSIRDMEALRFERLEEQKKKWVEVYCGLAPLVAQEYDGLVQLDKTHQEDGFPSIHFDPRPQFQKSADLGEDCLQFADNHFENLNTSDLSSCLPISDDMGCSAVEGEWSADDDFDEDYSSIQRPAFLVTGEPDFDSGPPQDGLEYLRRVRWEATRIPKVTVSKVNKIKEQSVYMPQIPDIMKCPENLLPLKQWEDSFLADFSDLRQAFARLDLQGSISKSSINQSSVDEEDTFGQMIESIAFDNFVSITPTDDTSSEKSCTLETSDAKVNPHSAENPVLMVDLPTLSKILKMESSARTAMLKRRINSVEDMSALPLNDSLWLFALCAAVDCPLHADTSAALRSLLRKCASLRAAKTQVDDELVILNILVTISGRYFGQLDS